MSKAKKGTKRANSIGSLDVRRRAQQVEAKQRKDKSTIPSPPAATKPDAPSK